ncbi:MAG: RidA family protein [Spirochaetaceae bacterium]|jgi:2-iminobutanoate/2-iminopropanoate deaminase|nr:RidA family protein [Spirochaetaceae bacterium]
MIKRMPTHCGDDTCASCVVAGNYVFLAHHGGGQDVDDIAHQVRATFESIKHTLSTVDATLEDIVQINFYLKNRDDFRKGADVFKEYFRNGAPARMTVFTEFVGESCLCQMDGIAYKTIQR